MKISIDRRRLMTLAAGMAICRPSVLRASELDRVRYAALSTGFSVIFDEYMSAKRFDRKHGIDMASVNTYVSVGSYLNDFAAGTFDLAVAGWDSVGELRHRGVPVQLASTLVTADMIHLLGTKDAPNSIADLKGKSIAAVMASGTYQLAKVLIRAVHGLELEKDITVQNVPNPAQAVTMLLAGNAPAALVWEPNVSIGMARDQTLKSIFNFGEGYRQKTGADLPYFGIGVRKDVLKGDLAARIAASIAECVASIKANPAEALTLAAKKLKIEPAILQSAYDNKRLRFLGGSMNNAADRASVANAAAFFKKNGAAWATLSDDYFIS